MKLSWHGRVRQQVERILGLGPEAQLKHTEAEREVRRTLEGILGLGPEAQLKPAEGARLVAPAVLVSSGSDPRLN